MHGRGRLVAAVGFLLVAYVAAAFGATPDRPGTGRSRLLLAHYMPCFEAAADGKSWGWHWTMNHYHPDRSDRGRQEAASHYRPLLGLYDSDDPDVLECHVQWLKLAGLDGVLIDWYGTEDLFDYAANHRRTQRLIEVVRRAGMRYAIVFEDQTVPKLVEAKKIPAEGVVEHGRKTVQWLQQHWFHDPAYLRQEDRPVLLVFGSGYYQPDQWDRIFAGLPQAPRLFTEAQVRPPAAGAFDWPQPRGGTEAALREAREFDARKTSPLALIPTAFPRFHDIYAEAGVHPSWGRVEDREGETYVETLTGALKTGAAVTQIATWNDWGEGTQIEPSAEFGYRDLEATQRIRKELLEPAFPFSARDLSLPLELFRLRKQHGKDVAVRSRLDAASQALLSGRPERARVLLAGLRQ